MLVVDKKKLSVILAFYNDSECIESAVKEITKHLDQIDEIDYEIIFVNDHSTDNSLQLILEQKKNK